MTGKLSSNHPFNERRGVGCVPLSAKSNVPCACRRSPFMLAVTPKDRR